MKSNDTEIIYLKDGDFFEFANLDKDSFRGLRVKKISDCAVLIEGEQLVDKKENVWRSFGVNYSISCSTRVRRLSRPYSPKETETKEAVEILGKRKRGNKS